MNDIPQQPTAQYNNYQQPNAQFAPVMTLKDWMIILLVMLIPLVNIIMMFVWAFGEGNPNRQNYFKASLLFAAIVIVLYIVFAVLFFGAIMASFA